MGALDISIVGPAIPPISKSFALNEGSLSWVFSIYVLFNLVFITPFTKLSDYLGRKVAYLVAIVLFASGSAICALASSYEMLLVGRAVQGLGSAGIFPIASAIIGDVIEPSRRGRFVGLLGSMFGLAFIIGPIVAGIMLKSLSWHYLFLVNIPISVILLIAASVYIPNNKQRSKDGYQIDYLGIILLGGSLALMTYGMTTLSHSPLASIVQITLAAFGLAAWYRVEKKIPNASINVAIISKKQIRNALSVGFGAGVFQAAFVFFPKFLVGTFDVSAASAGFMLVPLVIGTAIGAPVSGRLVDSVGSRRIVTTALPMLAMGFAIQGLLLTTWSFYVGSSLIGVGLAMLVGSSLRYIVLNETDSIDRASAQGVLTIAISGGQIVGSALIGLVVESSGSYSTVFLSISAISIALLAAAFKLRGREQELAHIATLKTEE